MRKSHVLTPSLLTVLLLLGGGTARAATAGPVIAENTTFQSVTVRIDSYVDADGKTQRGSTAWKVGRGRSALSLGQQPLRASSVTYTLTTLAGSKSWTINRLNTKGELVLPVQAKYLADPPGADLKGKDLEEFQVYLRSAQLIVGFDKDIRKKSEEMFDQKIARDSAGRAEQDALARGLKRGTPEFSRFVLTRKQLWAAAYWRTLESYLAAPTVKNTPPDNGGGARTTGTPRGMGLEPETPQSIRYFGAAQNERRLGAVLMPGFVDLSPDFPPPGNQGRQGSCTSWAVAYAAMSYYERVENGVNNRQAGAASQPNPQATFSPSFIHNVLSGKPDQGLAISEACKYVQSNGCATLAQMPYNDLDAATRPPGSARSNATRFRFKGWNVLWNDQLGIRENDKVLTAKRHLYDRRPVIIAARLDDQFQFLGRNPWASFRSARDPRDHGRHAMVVVGYDDRRQVFKVQNSWGQDLGDGGYWYITYGLFPQVVYAAYNAEDRINYNLTGTWKYDDGDTRIQATIRHDDRSDRVTGTFVLDSDMKISQGAQTVTYTGHLRIAVDGKVDRAYLVVAPEVELFSMKVPVTSDTQGRGFEEVVRKATGKTARFAVGDSFTMESSMTRKYNAYLRNGKEVGSERIDVATVKRRIDDMLGDNKEAIVFRTMPGTRSKLRLVLSVQNRTKDYELVKAR